jgi:hypothetical protein
MLQKSYRLKLARLLKLYQEVSTDRGLLIAENDDEITAGVEVFVENESGEIVPAPDGVYVDTVKKVQYVVEGSTIKEVVEYKDPEETTIEDKPEGNGDDANTESNETGNTAEVENPSETGETEEKPEGETEGNTEEKPEGETEEKPEGETEGNTEEKPEGETDPKDEQIAALTEENTLLKQQIAELEKKLAEYKEKEDKVPAQNVEMREKFNRQNNNDNIFEKKLEAAKRIKTALGK